VGPEPGCTLIDAAGNGTPVPGLLAICLVTHPPVYSGNRSNHVNSPSTV
jgi:hypothetical protein